MEKLTLILGPQGSGKTTKAEEIAADRETAYVYNFQGHLIQAASESLEVVILENVKKENLIDLKILSLDSYVRIRAPFSKTLSLKKVKIIATSSEIKIEDVKPLRHLEIIQL